VPPVRTSSR